VGGSPAMGWRTEGVQDAEDLEAGPHGDWGFQGGCLEVLPGEDRSLPHRPVPPMDEKQAHCSLPNSGGAGARRRLGVTSSRCALSGSPSRRFRGLRCLRKAGGGRAGGGSGTSPLGDAASRY